MFCPNCGVEVAESAKFCMSCGAQITILSAAPNIKNEDSFSHKAAKQAPPQRQTEDQSKVRAISEFPENTQTSTIASPVSGGLSITTKRIISALALVVGIGLTKMFASTYDSSHISESDVIKGFSDANKTLPRMTDPTTRFEKILVGSGKQITQTYTAINQPAAYFDSTTTRSAMLSLFATTNCKDGAFSKLSNAGYKTTIIYR